MSYSVGHTEDLKAATLSFNISYVNDIIRERLKVNISTPAFEGDDDYSSTLLSTPVETCKISQGIIASYFTKVFMENFYQALNANYTCPFKKDFNYQLTNCVMTDKFLPPTPYQILFKVSVHVFGMIQMKTKLQKLYAFEIYGRVRKLKL